MDNTVVSVSKPLLQAIKEAAYLEGSFTTRAGKQTDYYIDKYLFETRPDILEPLSRELAQLFPDPNDYDRIAAPELGAVPIGAVLAIRLNKPFIIVKKETKAYGTQKPIEGAYNDGETVVLLEDILTTGGTVIRSHKILKECGLNVHSVVGIINREEGAIENLANDGLKTKTLISTSDLKQCSDHA